MRICEKVQENMEKDAMLEYTSELDLLYGELRKNKEIYFCWKYVLNGAKTNCSV